VLSDATVTVTITSLSVRVSLNLTGTFLFKDISLIDCYASVHVETVL